MDLRDEARTTADAAVATAADRAAGALVLRDGPDVDIDGLAELAGLFDRVWGRAVSTMGGIVTREVLWANAHVGGQVTAAFLDGRLVAGTAAFLGTRPDGLVLHSHLTGVLPEHVGHGIGAALKWHQRAWCLDRDVPTVEWTYDPLVRRNAVFNLVRLGATPVEYLEDVYGPMHDDRNVGVPTDRLVARWDLAAPRVRQAAAGRHASPDVEALRRTGAEVALAADEHDAPVRHDTDAPRVLVRVPADVESLRRTDSDTARAWTDAVRATMGPRLASGARVTGITRDGWYVLARPGGLDEMA